MTTKTNLQTILEHKIIEVSAPARIDCGGTWDIKALALLNEKINPLTVNIAINLRTRVRLLPYDSKKICVDYVGYQKEEVYSDSIRLNTSFGLVFAIVSHFNISGVKIEIETDIPYRSGLGGSGVLAVALIKAISKALELIDQSNKMTVDNIALLAFNIEDGLQFSITGLQDQLAAAYGGVNKWSWCYSSFEHPYKRQVLLKEDQYEEIQKHILLAFSGESRSSKIVSLKYIKSFFKGNNQKEWLELRKATENFAVYISQKNWIKAASGLNNEASIREIIVPEVRTAISQCLREAAIKHNCGAATTGGNRAGCVWALGEEDSISNLKTTWKNIFNNHYDGYLIPITVSNKGIITNISNV